MPRTKKQIDINAPAPTTPPKKLTEKQKIFCQFYVVNWNASEAARLAGYSKKTAGSIGGENLEKPEIQAYIQHIQQNLEKYLGLSRAKVAGEYMKMAFSNAAEIFVDWIEKKDFEELSPEVKATISEISTQVKANNKGEMIEFIRVKFHDKQKALDALCKMFGYNEPEKFIVTPPDQEGPPRIQWT